MKAEQFILDENGWVPNNPGLPVLVYRGVEQGDCESVAHAFERRFEANGWPPDWRDTIYDYHHYHSTAHEALGVVVRSAKLAIGGPSGREVPVAAGDAIILPVGTGHWRISSSEDFLVVGAYVEGQACDICREAPSDEARHRMATLPIPRSVRFISRTSGCECSALVVAHRPSLSSMTSGRPWPSQTAWSLDPT
jgi:uncharacterized protein YjlB